jgi:hypothetical protein
LDLCEGVLCGEFCEGFQNVVIEAENFHYEFMAEGTGLFELSRYVLQFILEAEDEAKGFLIFGFGFGHLEEILVFEVVEGAQGEVEFFILLFGFASAHEGFRANMFEDEITAFLLDLVLFSFQRFEHEVAEETWSFLKSHRGHFFASEDLHLFVGFGEVELCTDHFIFFWSPRQPEHLLALHQEVLSLASPVYFELFLAFQHFEHFVVPDIVDNLLALADAEERYEGEVLLCAETFEVEMLVEV